MDPAGMRRRVKNPNDRGGTEGPVAASTRPPPTEGNGFRRRLRVALIKTVGRGDSRAVLRRRRSDALQSSPILLKKERQPRPSLLLDWRGRGFRINRADCSMNSLNRSSETAERIPTRALEDIITCVSHLDDWF